MTARHVEGTIRNEEVFSLVETPRLSHLASELPRSGIRKAQDLAGDRPNLVHLEFGEPDFITPEPIRQAVADAILTSRMVYTPTPGPTALRAALAAKVRQVNGDDAATSDNIFVTHGGTGALMLSVATVVNPGDKVLVPDPGWPNYVGQVLAAGATPVPYPLAASDGYLPDPDGWPLTDDVRLVILNSPSNPAGSVTPPDVSRRIADICRQRGIWILSDEVYDQIYFDVQPTAMRPLYPERTISVYSFSKTYAMTGWRLGYLVAPRDATDAMKKVAENIYSSTSTIAQKGAMVALSLGPESVAEMVASYRGRRDLAVHLLDGFGRRHYTPQGAFYLMVDVSGAGDGDAAARTLVLDKGVVTVAGSAFGASTTSALRLSLASREDDIRKGLAAVAEVARW